MNPPTSSPLQLEIPSVGAAQDSLSTSTPNSTVFTENMKLPVHGWFRFSAGFSAEWAAKLIREQPPAEVRVLDPFVGSGTTAIAAQQVGAEAVGVENHPFYVRIARAKASWPSVSPAQLRRRSERLLEQTWAVEPTDVAPLLVKCFQPESLGRLLGLRRSLIENQEGDEIDEMLWLALVAILRRCSFVGTAQWQYVLPDRRKARVAEPWQAFRDQVARMSNDLLTLQAASARGGARILQTDARSCEAVPDGWANLVITSPPYPNNFDYADAARLEMSFLGEITSWGDLQRGVRQHLVRSCSQHMAGFDSSIPLSDVQLAPIKDELSEVVEQLATLRKERAGHKAYDAMVAAYFLDLADVWRALRRTCGPGASVCFVVGDSAPYGVHVPVERWLGELAVAAGFHSWEFEKLRDRNTKWKNRKHRVPLQEGRLWVRG